MEREGARSTAAWEQREIFPGHSRIPPLCRRGPPRYARRAPVSDASDCNCVVRNLRLWQRSSCRSIRGTADHATCFIDYELVSVVYANLGSLAAAMRYGKKETIQIRDEQRRASAGCCREVGKPNEGVAIGVLEHVDESVAATDVESLARDVVKQVVGVADDRKRAHFLAGVGIEYQHLRRSSAPDEQAVVRFIERHR